MAKYRVGQIVRCYREEIKDRHIGFNFSGEILDISGDENDPEYIIENAPILPFLNFPCLIWEDEIIGEVL